MVTLTIEGIDLFKVPGRSISGWIPSLKTGIAVRQPFCSQIEERLGSGLNLQNVDGRGLMQSAFPCHVHADAHDWRQLLMFEGKTCSLDGAFTNCLANLWKHVRETIPRLDISG
jgi:hypothetical protein